MSHQQISFEFANQYNGRNRGNGIGAFAVKCLSEGWTPKETLELVRQNFPLSETSIKCIYWYASKNRERINAGREQLANQEIQQIQGVRRGAYQA